jgi:hypothetical protein
MQRKETRKRHRTKLDHIHCLIERCSLRCRGLASKRGEVQMITRGQDVLANKPIGGLNLIEPGKPPLIGVAAITIPFENLMNIRRHLEFGRSRLGTDAWTHAL